MSISQEQFIRRAYEIAGAQDLAGWVDCFTDDGTWTDYSILATYAGAKELAEALESYAVPFPDMRRDLEKVYVTGNKVVVELSLNGTHTGPLHLETGTVPPSGKTVKVPCCDVFTIRDGKIESFHCYPTTTVMFAQLGILMNMEAATRS